MYCEDVQYILVWDRHLSKIASDQFKKYIDLPQNKS